MTDPTPTTLPEVLFYLSRRYFSPVDGKTNLSGRASESATASQAYADRHGDANLVKQGNALLAEQLSSGEPKAGQESRADAIEESGNTNGAKERSATQNLSASVHNQSSREANGDGVETLSGNEEIL